MEREAEFGLELMKDQGGDVEKGMFGGLRDRNCERVKRGGVEAAGARGEGWVRKTILNSAMDV